MGFIKNLIVQRRLNKIDAIERELEKITEAKLGKQKPKELGLKATVVDPETKKFRLKNDFVKADSSLFLLFVVVIVTAALIGTTAFYQIKLSNINNEFTGKIVEVDKLRQELLAKESNLSVVQQTLSIKEQREEELEDVLQEEREDLKNEIKILNSDKADLEADVKELENKIAKLEADNRALRDRIDELESQ